MKEIINAAARYVAIEIKFRIKWIGRDIAAWTKGYRSHQAMMQNKLRHNAVIREGMKRFPAGYYLSGKVHDWSEALYY